MSPQPGREVHLTDLETRIMRAFIETELFKIMNDKDMAKVLHTLADKLEGNNA